MDVDTVEYGVDFVHAIEQAVGECDVLVALIGKRWAGGESGGTSRLDNTKDYVRLEVSTALARDIWVIPVLVDGMTMPNEDSLPSLVQPITRRNAIEISNTRFNYDVDHVDQLITAVRKILGETEAKCQADEENRKRIEEDRNRAQQEAEQRRPKRQPSIRQSDLEQPEGRLKPGAVLRDTLEDGSPGPEMVVIPTGTFRMGDISGNGNMSEQPAHSVRINRPFVIGLYEVTFEEYDQFAGATGRKFSSGNRWGRGRQPIINVSWEEMSLGKMQWPTLSGCLRKLPNATDCPAKLNGNMPHAPELRPCIGGEIK